MFIQLIVDPLQRLSILSENEIIRFIKGDILIRLPYENFKDII